MTSRRLMAATFAGAMVVLAGAGVAIRDARTGDDQAAVRSADMPATTVVPMAESKAAMTGTDMGTSAGAVGDGDDFAVQGGAAAAGVAGDRAMSPELAQGAPPVPNQQQVIKTADVRVELKRGDFRRAFDQASAAATSMGGFVVNSSSERVDGRLASGTLVLRVPADRFDAVRAKLAGLGTVEQESVQGSDVSGQLVDLDARLRSMRAQEDALVLLMGKARTVGETIEVQQQLSNVRMQIEQMAAEQARLKDAVALSTITVSMAEPGAALATPAHERSGLARSVERAGDAVIAVVGGTIVVLGYVLPLSVLVLFAWLVGRAFLRRRRSDPAPAPAAG